MRRVLCLVSHYLPGYKAGGALRSVASMAAVLAGSCRFAVLTSDRDLGDPTPYQGVVTDCWTSSENGQVFYASRPCAACVREIRGGGWDVLYVNSFFNPCFAILPVVLASLFRKRLTVIVAPRGEFSSGALAIKSFKKRSFLWLARSLGLYRKVIWHASTELEAVDIRRAVGRDAREIRISADIPMITTTGADEQEAGQLAPCSGPLRICFVSRISPMKNLEFALRVLKEANVPLRFDIYGPVEDKEYAARCLDIASLMPADVRVQFMGPVPHGEVLGRISQYHLFFFPTLGENFGHVIAEALAAGTPVLISNETPWRGLQVAGAGWEVPLSRPEEFVRIVREFSTIKSDHYNAMRCAAKSFNANVDLDQKRKELLDLLTPVCRGDSSEPGRTVS